MIYWLQPRPSLRDNNTTKFVSYIMPPQSSAGWTFLSNYSHVLLCLAQDPLIKMRDVAARVGITERAVQRIIAELEGAEVLTRVKTGRQNTYTINPSVPLRHELESHRTVGDLLDALMTGMPRGEQR